jgi:hypothetical protein
VTIHISHLEAASNILELTLSGRLIQSKWQSENEQGQRVACLLGAIHAGIKEVNNCPSSLMPDWLSSNVPGAFDGLPKEKATKIGAQFAEYLARWSVLTDEQWETIRKRLNVAALRRDEKDVDHVVDHYLTGFGTPDPDYPFFTENWSGLYGHPNFGDLFGLLDAILPPAVERDFTFSTTSTFTVTSKSAVQATIIARQRHADATMVTSLVERHSAIDEVIADPSDAPAWVDIHHKARDEAAKTYPEVMKFSSTTELVPFLRSKFGPVAKSPELRSVLDNKLGIYWNDNWDRAHAAAVAEYPNFPIKVSDITMTEELSATIKRVFR